MKTPLVGRRRELEQAVALLERAFAGPATGLMLEGEPGIGKTRLLDEVVALGQAAGFATHRAGARELDRQRPFGVIADAIGAERDSPDPDLARIAALLSGGGAEAGASAAARGPELAFQLIELIVDLLAGLSAEGPLLLAVDDLQWSDPSSLALLARVLRRLSDAPLALVLACRPEPRSGELEQLLDGLSGAGHPVLRLGPLEEQDVAELVEQALGRQAGEDLLSRLSGARGNPFLVRELVVALRDGDPAQAPLPASLREAVLRRMRSLPREELELLRAASILGSAFAATDLAAIAGQPVAALLGSLSAALRAGLLDEAGERLAFRHDLLREVLYQDLPRALRSALHRDAAGALARVGAPAIRVAIHMGLGAEHGDLAAVDWLRRAASEAGPLAPSVGIELLERALELSPRQDPVHDEVIAELVDMLVWSGAPAPGEQLARELLARHHDAALEGRV